MEIIEEGKDYKIIKHGKREYVISKQPGIQVKQFDAEDDKGPQVIISHNIISQNGFESVTDCLHDIKKVFTYLVIAVSCCGIAYIISLKGLMLTK